jgi:dCTP deaminase
MERDDSMTLFPEDTPQTPATSQGQTFATGILPAHGIRAMVREQQIWAPGGVLEDQVQPARLDLRLGTTAYRVRASFLPGAHGRVMDKIEDLAYHKIDLTHGAVLETNCVYLVPVMEALALPEQTTAFANPKSSTGRIDVFTRIIADFGCEFDKIPAGYKGHLYLEISPRTFPILVRAGSRLSQIRFRRGARNTSDNEMRRLHDEQGLVDGTANIDDGLALSIDLRGDGSSSPIGYRAKRHAGMIDVDRSGALDWRQYWEAIMPDTSETLILDPDEFYILASREAITIPGSHAAEMVPFNPLVGEFRVHYAGFFDPGFGAREANGAGSRAVLEVRSREVPFILEHGQVIGRLIYERLTMAPEKLYGEALQSNYQRQGLRLSKHFK